MVFLKSGGLFGRGFAPFDPPLVLGVFLALDILPPLGLSSKPPKFALLGDPNIFNSKLLIISDLIVVTVKQFFNSSKLNIFKVFSP